MTRPIRRRRQPTNCFGNKRPPRRLSVKGTVLHRVSKNAAAGANALTPANKLVAMTMKRRNERLWRMALVLLTLTAGVCRGQTNFSVFSPNGTNQPYYFTVTGPGENGVTQNPPITLQAGNTYTFTISTTPGFHQVDITTAPFPSPAVYYGGASAQIVDTGTITLAIPATNYPSSLYYICQNHGFYGVISITAPTAAAPPRNSIISITLTPTTVTVTSTGTNTTYNLVPEFNSNLSSGTWQSVPNGQFTNTFTNGTNTTSFNRLEPVCGPNVFLRISQRPPQ
jgi:hypothetical protein